MHCCINVSDIFASFTADVSAAKAVNRDVNHQPDDAVHNQLTAKANLNVTFERPFADARSL